MGQFIRTHQVMIALSAVALALTPVVVGTFKGIKKHQAGETRYSQYFKEKGYGDVSFLAKLYADKEFTNITSDDKTGNYSIWNGDEVVVTIHVRDMQKLMDEKYAQIVSQHAAREQLFEKMRTSGRMNSDQ